MQHRIDGVEKIKRGFFQDARGQVRHGFRASEGTIGEAYLSVVNQGAVKAWHVHKKMTLRYVAVKERIMVGLVDVREDSPTFGAMMKFELTPYGEAYSMLIIPPGVANGFRLPPRNAALYGIILNVPDMEYDPDDITRIAIDDFPHPFEWGSYNVSG